MSSFNLIVDSRKRLSGSSNDFVLKYNGNFPPISEIRLRWISVPLSNYTIDSNSSTIYFNENGQDKIAVLPVGYYSGTALATALTTALNSASGGFSTWNITYSNTTYKFTWNSTNSFTLQWSKTGTPYSQCGFTQTDASSSGNTVTSQNAAELNQPLGVIVSIKEFDSTIYNGSSITNGTFCPLDSGSSYLNTWEPHTPYKVKILPRVIDRLTVCLYDLNGNLLDLAGGNWVMHLEVIQSNEWEERSLKRRFE